MIKCPNCTAELKFSVKDQEIKCPYCGSKFTPKELKDYAKKVKAEKKVIENNEEPGKTIEGKCYRCNDCGAELLTFDDTAVTFCSYCGSQAMLEDKMIEQNAPEYIIPFKKTKDECVAEYKKKLKKSLFAPNYMKDDVVVSKFRGIYMPYCIYTLSKHGPANNKGSKYSHRSGNYDYYDDYTITSDVDADYEGLNYDLTSKFYDRFSKAIPYDFNGAEEFNPSYLSGFYADTKDVDSTTYDEEAARIASNDTTHHLSKKTEFRKYGCYAPKINLSVSSRKTGMFPVYFLAVRDKKNENVHYAVVNGQTGKIAMDLPIDFKKYILGSLLLTIPIFLLINLGLVLTPKVLVIITILLAFISLILSATQISAVKNRATLKDDKGYTQLNPQVKKKKNKEKKSNYYVVKQILIIVLLVFTLIANFVNDIYYYTAIFISLLVILLSFKDIVKEHNDTVSSKLPQLEKRGGDEHD